LSEIPGFNRKGAKDAKKGKKRKEKEYSEEKREQNKQKISLRLCGSKIFNIPVLK
jgi:hypothetical protein